jgi:DNA/RNA endonuclease YhcR with UshA esterase domain
LQKIVKRDILIALKGAAYAQAFWVEEDPTLQESIKTISQESSYNNLLKR